MRAYLLLIGQTHGERINYPLSNGAADSAGPDGGRDEDSVQGEMRRHRHTAPQLASACPPFALLAETGRPVHRGAAGSPFPVSVDCPQQSLWRVGIMPTSALGLDTPARDEFLRRVCEWDKPLLAQMLKDSRGLAKKLLENAFLAASLSPGASKPATHGRLKPSH